MCSLLLVEVYSNSNLFLSSSPPLAVISNGPYSVAKYDANVPLVLVDNTALAFIRDPKISAVSPTDPLVLCRTGGQYDTVSSMGILPSLQFLYI